LKEIPSLVFTSVLSNCRALHHMLSNILLANGRETIGNFSKSNDIKSSSIYQMQQLFIEQMVSVAENVFAR